MKTRNSIWDNDPEGYDALRNQQECWISYRRFMFVRDWLTVNAPSGNVLELGSGTGQFAADVADSLPEMHWTGIEPLPSYVAYARDKIENHALQNRVGFIEGLAENATRLNLQKPFDAIISNDVLHHIDDVEQAVHSIAQVANPGALWCAIEPNALNPYACFNQWRKKGERNFWPNRFISIAERAGWELVERRTIFLIPPFIRNPSDWMKALERKLERVPFLGGGIVLIMRRKQK